MKKSVTVVLGVVLFVLTMSFLINISSSLNIVSVTFEHLPDNRLRFKVAVLANQKCDAVVMYWQKNSTDTLYSTLSANSKNHTLWIVNSKANKNYQFQVLATSGKNEKLSKVYDFKTKEIYHATPYFTLEYSDSVFAREIDDKFFLTQKLSQPGSAMIINHKGEIVWYQAFEKGAKVTNWTPEKSILCIVGPDSIPFSGGDEIVEISLSGEVIRQLHLGKGSMDKIVHHEVRYDHEGNIYALTFDRRVFDLRKYGGGEMDSVLGDGIVMFNAQNQKIWEWSVFDHLDPLADPMIVKDRKDWVHANSLYRDHEGNFLISFRDLSQVWKIDYRDGSVIWKLGQEGTFNMPDQDVFSGQHAVYSDHNNQVIMLDNGLHKRKSRVLGFNIDSHSNYVHASINIPLAKEYFSVPKGNASIIGQDKILVCASEPKSLLIINKKGQILWKVSVGGDPYRIEMIDTLTETPII